jgi:hypothetical protein
MFGVIVSEEPLLPRTPGDPDSKVESYLDASDAFVALCTPDDQLEDDTVQCRQISSTNYSGPARSLNFVRRFKFSRNHILRLGKLVYRSAVDSMDAQEARSALVALWATAWRGWPPQAGRGAGSQQAAEREHA